MSLQTWIDRTRGFARAALHRTRERSGAFFERGVFRAEAFGGVIALGLPRALVFVDRDFARGLGHDGGATWARPEADSPLGAAPLRAPLEAHLQLTNKCSAGCQGCYTGATPKGASGEWGFIEWQRALDELARMGVFHVALGGGESADLPWLPELAAYANKIGLLPNLTTSGLSGLETALRAAPHLGQINVSMDGLGSDYARVRGFDGFARADHAIRALRQIKAEVGINVVVTRHNFDKLGDIFRYARARRLNEVELLRYKPSGRARKAWDLLACTQEQHRALLPTLRRLLLRHPTRVRVDCSYTPMVAWHDPGPELLKSLAVYGCTGGDFLIGARASGVVTACSFAAPPTDGPKVDTLGAYWTEPGAFGAFREWQSPAAPCSTCSYQALCRGGCRVVSDFLAGDPRAPDPECPKVVEFHRRQAPPSISARRRSTLPVLM